jgi:hypothetical protein
VKDLTSSFKIRCSIFDIHIPPRGMLGGRVIPHLMRNPHHHPLRPPPVVIPAKAGIHNPIVIPAKAGIHNPYPAAERTAPTNSTVSGYWANATISPSVLGNLAILQFLPACRQAGQ